MLMRSMEKKRSGEAGFTLVELLVVIAILGILAAIVVFAVGGITDRGQTAANKTTCSVLQSAEEAYFATHSAYAPDQATLKTAGLIHDVVPGFGITLGSGSYTIAGC